MMKQITQALIALLPLVAATVPARAQNAATTADFRWLAGRWEGRMAANPGAIADVTFSAPSARSIVGSIRLVQNDTVLVVELISLVDTPAGVEMRFRHFSSQLVAYEARFEQAMRLRSHDGERDMFENTVPYDKELMSTQPRTTTFVRQGPDKFIGRSNIMDSAGKPAVMEVTYQRMR
jgi:hypothetical protein